MVIFASYSIFINQFFQSVHNFFLKKIFVADYLIGVGMRQCQSKYLFCTNLIFHSDKIIYQ